MDRLRSRGARSLTRLSSMYMSPEVMSSRPTIIRSRVDLPQPDGPTRIMNSPSAMSSEMSLTAGNPSPYCLTMWFSLMRAMVWSLLGASSPVLGRGSALDGTGREPGDDPALEEQDEDDDRDRHDDGGRADGAGGLLELRCAGEEGQRCRDGARPLGRQGDREHEVVPGDEERDDGGGEDPGRRQGNDHLPEGLPAGGAVHLGGLLHLPGDLLEEGRERPDADRQRQRQVGDDQADLGVEEADGPPQVVDRRDEADDREDRHGQGRGEDELLAGEVQPRDGIGRERREDHADHRG